MLDGVNEFLFSSTAFFDEIYVFGSALWSQSPNDIDILLVYDDAKFCEVEAERAQLEAELRDKIGDIDFHFTTLSRTELQYTDFLSLVRYKKLK